MRVTSGLISDSAFIRTARDVDPSLINEAFAEGELFEDGLDAQEGNR